MGGWIDRIDQTSTDEFARPFKDIVITNCGVARMADVPEEEPSTEQKECDVQEDELD